MPKKKPVGQPAAKAPAPKAKRAAAPKASAKSSSIVIDYPLEGEIVTSANYTMRLSALTPRSVEVSLDGKEWRPCRESVGYWWYDWSGYASGPYSLHARMTDASGRSVKVRGVRQFTVLT